MRILVEKIIAHIPNEIIKDHLKANADNLTIMQLATLIDNFCDEDYIANMQSLIVLTSNEYEKKLFSYAISDFKKYKSIDEKACDYYDKNDPREVKPLCPFQEFIELPRLLNDYDIGLLEDNDIVVVGKINEAMDQNIEFGDLSYLVYHLDYDGELSKEAIFKIHDHIHYCEITKISTKNLNKKQKDMYDKLVIYLKEIGY